MCRRRISIGLLLFQTSACLGDGFKHVNFTELFLLLALLFIGAPLLGVGLGVGLVRHLTKRRGNWKQILGAGVAGIAAAVPMTVYLFFSLDTIHLFGLMTPFILGGLSGSVVSSLLFWKLTNGAPQENVAD